MVVMFFTLHGVVLYTVQTPLLIIISIITTVLYLKVAFSNPGYLNAAGLPAATTTEAFDVDEDIEQMKRYQDRTQQLQKENAESKKSNKLKKKQSVLSKMNSTAILSRGL
jgi:hypothetical protein